MIDIRRLRQDPDGVRAALARRGDAALDRIVGHLLALDIRRRELLTTVETLKAERNAMSDEVARRKKAKESADDLLATLKASGDRVKLLDAEVKGVDEELERELMVVPNLPLPEVPDGDATNNKVVRTWGRGSASSTSRAGRRWRDRGSRSSSGWGAA